jgi:hypothetical protein
MNLDNETRVAELLAIARDESKTQDERYGALRLACQLRDDPYRHVPLEQLASVASAAGFSKLMGKPLLCLQDAAEAVASGFARRTTSDPHQ